MYNMTAIILKKKSIKDQEMCKKFTACSVRKFKMCRAVI